MPAIYQLIRDLAAYERALPEVTGTQEDLHALAVRPRARRVRARGRARGQVAGFALWFLNYSTWLCQHGIYLEDLYVRPELRGSGLGRALLAELASLCVERGYGRLEWWVLDWNEPALGFYASLGATAHDGLDRAPADRRPAARAGGQPRQPARPARSLPARLTAVRP